MIKRDVITASLLALGGIGIITPRASAETYQVPMNATAADFCLLQAGVVVPGLLQVSGNGDELETTTPGSVTYLCNETTEAVVNTPTQNLAFVGSAGELDVTATAQIVGVTNVSAGVPTIETDLSIGEGTKKEIGGGLNTVLVGMSATNSDIIPAGIYSFDVPLTITVK